MTPEAAAEEQVRRGRGMARVVPIVVGLGVVVSFVVENDQRVRVRLWFLTGHPRLIWVVLAAVVIGVAVGALVSRALRKRRARRPAGWRRLLSRGSDRSEAA